EVDFKRGEEGEQNQADLAQGGQDPAQQRLRQLVRHAGNVRVKDGRENSGGEAAQHGRPEDQARRDLADNAGLSQPAEEEGEDAGDEDDDAQLQQDRQGQLFHRQVLQGGGARRGVGGGERR